MKEIVGTHNIVFMTLDTLRFDVAQRLYHLGETPHFAELMGAPWEERHTPGTFTYAAHHAFFGGFLPTLAAPGIKQTRLFGGRFAGSETSGPETFLYDEPDVVTACVSWIITRFVLAESAFLTSKRPSAASFPIFLTLAIGRLNWV